MTDDQGSVLYSVKDRIGTITLSRPEKLNSLTLRMFTDLGEAVDRVRNDGDVRVLVIRGEGGRAFSAGDDLGQLVRMSAGEARDFLITVQGIFTGLEALPVPVVAAVQGFALGGGLELALACDIILASESARLGLPEINIGIMPGLGGCIRLPRRVGVGHAKEMVFSGEPVSAERALVMGLVEAVYPEDVFEEEVRTYAGTLAGKSPVSLTLAKSVVNRGMDASLEAGLALEREAFAYCFSQPDAKEGISAFLEKRKPRFGK